MNYLDHDLREDNIFSFVSPILIQLFHINIITSKYFSLVFYPAAGGVHPGP